MSPIAQANLFLILVLAVVRIVKIVAQDEMAPANSGECNVLQWPENDQFYSNNEQPLLWDRDITVYLDPTVINHATFRYDDDPNTRYKFWYEEILPQLGLPAHKENGFRSFVLFALAHIMDYSCVRFHVVENQTALIKTDYIHIHLSDSCEANLGRNREGGATHVYLDPNGCGKKFGTVVHEIMHALGFIHEHTRFDAKSFVIVDPDKINDHNYQIQGAEYQWVQQFAPYDYYSVMHYSREQGVTPLVEPFPQKEKENRQVSVGQRLGLSHMDMIKLNRMFKCFEDKRECRDETTEQCQTAFVCPKDACKKTCGKCKCYLPHEDEDYEEIYSTWCTTDMSFYLVAPI